MPARRVSNERLQDFATTESRDGFDVKRGDHGKSEGEEVTATPLHAHLCYRQRVFKVTQAFERSVSGIEKKGCSTFAAWTRARSAMHDRCGRDTRGRGWVREVAAPTQEQNGIGELFR